MSLKTQKSAAKTGLAIAGSRLLGLIREVILNAVFGPGLCLDAFIAAFRIPNLLRDLFAEGALSAAFVTVFSKTNKTDGNASAFQLANSVLTALTLFMALIVGIGIAGAPALMVLVPGWKDASPEKIELTIELIRILFPFIGFVSVAALFMGLLNSLGSFGLPASASMVFNAVAIVCGVGLGYAFDPELGPRAIYGFAIGTVIGGVAQLAFQVPKALSYGYRPKWTVDWKSPAFRKVLLLMGPALLGGAAIQINVLVSQGFASYLGDGAVTWLYDAFRLVQLPIALFGVAYAMVTLPSISRSAAVEDFDEFRSNLFLGVGNAFFLSLPAAVGLAILAEPIISLVFERGAFTSADTKQCALALQGYAIGLSCYSVNKIFTQAFYPLDLPRIPVIIGFIGIFLNFAFCLVLIFVWHLGVFGLALSTSAVVTLNTCQLVYYLRRRLGRLKAGYLFKDLALMFVAAGAMGGSVYLVYLQIVTLMTKFSTRCLGVLFLICLGAGVYLGLCVLFRLPQAALIRHWARLIRRRD